MTHILVVEDDAHIAEGLCFNLEAEGFETTWVENGREAVESLTALKCPFDLVILDLMLPEVGGFEVARKTRAAGNYVAILMLTALDAGAELIRGLEEGADDYLTKPFRLDELLVRVRGLLRRRRWDGVEPGGSAALRPVQIGQVQVHFDRFELTTPDETIQLTTREMALLRALLQREGEAVTRGELLEEVWGLRPDTRTRVVDSFIVRLRRYIEEDPSRPRHITSVRGHGYRLIR